MPGQEATAAALIGSLPSQVHVKQQQKVKTIVKTKNANKNKDITIK